MNSEKLGYWWVSRWGFALFFFHTLAVQRLEDMSSEAGLPAASGVPVAPEPCTRVPNEADESVSGARRPCAPVSYTHLTLPTICSV